MKRITTALFLLVASGVFAQQQKTVSGEILDQENHPLVGAEIYVPSLDETFYTNENGEYSIVLPEGNHELEVQYFGYKSALQSVTILGEDVKNINFVLVKENIEEQNIDLRGATINATRNRSSEAELLNIQKKSVNIVTNVGAQELERKGVSDAATALTKVSGVSRLEGTSAIYVRGLGDRYISTTFNGLPLPSNDPEYKNIDLGFFDTDIIEYLSVDKVYSPKVLGDFSGAGVDIVSKNYTGKGMLQISMGSNFNTNAVGKPDFMLQSGPSKTGFSDIKLPNDPLNTYQFKTKLNPSKSATIGPNFGITAGKSFRIGAQGKLGLFATANFDSDYDFREGLDQTVNASTGLGARLKSFDPHKKYSYQTNSTGMFNANYKINQDHSLKYNLLFINSSEQSRDLYYGFIRDLAEDDNGLIIRNTYTQNTLMVNQLLGNNKLSSRLDLDWALGYNKIESDLPDRTQNTLRYDKASDVYRLVQVTTTDNHRYFHNLNENSYVGNIGFTYKLNENAAGIDRGFIRFGYNGKIVERDFEARQFNFRIVSSQLNNPVDPNNLDAFFNQSNLNNGYFSISTYNGTLAPQTYNGEQNSHAAYATVEYNLSERLSAMVGVRYENIVQKIDWRTQLDASERTNELKKDYFLPSVILKYMLNDRQNLRFAASKTYTLPQFKERALFLYEDVTQTKYGNPYLYPSQNYNVDLKWEMFPNRGELISLTAFGKYIQDPINEVVIASSTNDISWINGDYGYVVGAEVELRKNILDFGYDSENTLSAGFNASYMKTDQEIDKDKVYRETNGVYNLNLTTPKARLAGASDLILNADISYHTKWRNDGQLMATLAYAYYSDRIYALNNEQMGNLVDKSFGTLDFILRTKLNQNVGINLSAKNLLNQTFKRVQENTTEDITVVSYKTGVNFGLSVNYNF
ncbi:TonB-dependent receptor domain-containing protein [Vaginella massiliensis]|uniref:TonB-dependent receptor n=1 Tax=Vaginella massiliensis TaxID=1816680 RepID=UPI00375133C9